MQEFQRLQGRAGSATAAGESGAATLDRRQKEMLSCCHSDFLGLDSWGLGIIRSVRQLTPAGSIGPDASSYEQKLRTGTCV